MTFAGTDFPRQQWNGFPRYGFGLYGNAEKDFQRSKTSPESRHTLSLIWGTNVVPGRAAETEA